jgi:hypothetical protein
MWTSPVHKARPVIRGSDFPGDGARSWRPVSVLLVIGATVSLAAIAWAVLTSQPLDRLVAITVAAVFAAVTVVGYRRRLIAGPRGLLVHGIGSPRILPWSQIRSIRSARSAHLGISSATLEIDTVDDELLVFSRIDLGADPAEVLAAVSAWWRPNVS